MVTNDQPFTELKPFSSFYVNIIFYFYTRLSFYVKFCTACCNFNFYILRSPSFRFMILVYPSWPILCTQGYPWEPFLETTYNSITKIFTKNNLFTIIHLKRKWIINFLFAIFTSVHAFHLKLNVLFNKSL